MISLHIEENLMILDVKRFVSDTFGVLNKQFIRLMN